MINITSLLDPYVIVAIGIVFIILIIAISVTLDELA